MAVEEDIHGDLWIGNIGTTGNRKGAIRYRRNPSKPLVRISSVNVGHQQHTDLSAIGVITTGNRITFEYNSIDFKTRPEQRQYHCKIEGVDTEWQTPTKSRRYLLS